MRQSGGRMSGRGPSHHCAGVHQNTSNIRTTLNPPSGPGSMVPADQDRYTTIFSPTDGRILARHVPSNSPPRSRGEQDDSYPNAGTSQHAPAGIPSMRSRDADAASRSRSPPGGDGLLDATREAMRHAARLAPGHSLGNNRLGTALAACSPLRICAAALAACNPMCG